MSYIENNLMRGERVIYRGEIHWFIFVPGTVSIVFAIIFLNGTEGAAVFGFLLLLFAAYSLTAAFITKISTELAITSKRVIAKTGLISRKTVELNHSKVESFNVDQSIFGRIFGFGTIVVCGTGGGKTPVPSIANPLDFRRHAMQTVDEGTSGVSEAKRI